MVDTRVVIVDDSIVFRRLLEEVLSQADGIEVVGRSSNGKLAQTATRANKPDVVTLDVEMPVMDGIEALKLIRRDFPDVDVIMFSSLTSKSAAMTIEALTAGAKGFVTKPREGTPEQNVEAIERDLIPLIRSLRNKRSAASSRSSAVAGTTAPQPKRPKGAKYSTDQLRAKHYSAVVIGVSTGGPNALQKVLPALPSSLRVPVLIVQHMPPIFTKQLAERLDALCALKVVEAEDGMPVEARRVYIAPGDYHMVLEGQHPNSVRIRLNQEPRENSCRPAVDPLFRSAARVWSKNTLGVVLTGMGADGMRGSEVLRREGATVLAQDMDTSVVWGMPGAVVERGLADMVLPLDKVAPTIADFI